MSHPIPALSNSRLWGVLCFLIALPLAAAGPHEHGNGRLDISFDGQRGEVELEVSADAVLGSEKSPKTPSQKKQEQSALQTFESEIKARVTFVDANCRWTSSQIKVDRHKEGRAEHADVEFQGQLQCAKPIRGSVLRVNLTEKYPGLAKIRAQIVTSDFQKGGVFDSDTSSLRLD